MTLTDLSKSLLRIAAALVLIVAAFWICPRMTRERPENSGRIIKTDTIRIRDTIHIDRPIVKTVRVVDTMRIASIQLDTIIVSDTVYIQLPREQKEYSGADYHAWVSGFRPQLDSIEIFPETRQISTTIIPPAHRTKRIGIGLQAGYGATLNGNQVQLSPYIGIGVSWNILSL